MGEQTVEVVQGKCPFPTIVRYTNTKNIELNQVSPNSTRSTGQYSCVTKNAYTLVRKIIMVGLPIRRSCAPTGPRAKPKYSLPAMVESVERDAGLTLVLHA